MSLVRTESSRQPARRGTAVTTAVVADRWPLMRVGLARAVTMAGLRASGEGRDLAEAVAAARQCAAGVVVVGDVDETTLATQRRALGTTLVVALVRHVTREELTRLISAGVAGISLRSATLEELADVVRRAVTGELAVAPALVSSMMGWSPDRADLDHQLVPPVSPATGDRPGPLTTKERQVLIALAAGASNHQIAEQLYVSQATIKTHLAHIYAKLGVGSRHEALSRAIALGIVH